MNDDEKVIPFGKPKEANPKFPSNPETIAQQEEVIKERRWVLSLKDSDIFMTGFIGLTPSFLAIADDEGRVKFAAADGYWQYVTDVTDQPNYDEYFDTEKD